MTLVPFLVLRNSKFSLTTIFSCFCSRIRLTAVVRTIRGGPGLAGAAASRDVASMFEESVPCQILGTARRNSGWLSPWGSCLQQYTLLLSKWSSLICAVPLALPEFFEVILLGGCALLCITAGELAFSTAFNSGRATVYVPYRALNRLFPLRTLQKFCSLPNEVTNPFQL
jgi:hypothetical protein